MRYSTRVSSFLTYPGIRTAAAREPFAPALRHHLDGGHAGPLSGHHDAADRDGGSTDGDEADDPWAFEHRPGDDRVLGPRVEREPRLVRRGVHPCLGIGPVPVARVRVRDRGASGPEDRIRFTSTLLPKSYAGDWVTTVC